MNSSNSSFTTPFGVTLPWLVYGTAWKKDRTADLVVQAVENGFKGIDTACQPLHYNEPMVGEALKRLNAAGITREDLYLQTKFTPLGGHDPNKIPYDSNAPVNVQIAQSFEISKQNLQTDYVDTLIMHSPLEPHNELIKGWKAMEKIHENSGARQLGISNCYSIEVLKKLYEEATIKPAVLQNRFYKETGYDIELREFCKKNHVIYQSFWTLTANPHVLQSETMQTITQKYQKTASQVFFRYLNQQGIVPLTGTTSQQHMQEDLNVFDFELNEEDISQITSLLK